MQTVNATGEDALPINEEGYIWSLVYSNKTGLITMCHSVTSNGDRLLYQMDPTTRTVIAAPAGSVGCVVPDNGMSGATLLYQLSMTVGHQGYVYFTGA